MEILNPGIYQFRNLINQKIYVGSSKNVDERKESHLVALRTKTHGNSHFQDAFNKYGEENFIFEIIELVPQISDEDRKMFKKRLVNDREQFYLDTLLHAHLYDGVFETKGYNILRKADSPLGLKRSEEQKEKRKNTIFNHPELFDHLSIPVLCYNLQGELIQKFRSTQEAARTLNIDGSGVIQCRQGKTQRFKAYIFKPFEGEVVQNIEPYKHSMKDKKREKVVIDKIANSNRGKKRTEEQCENASKIRLALKLTHTEATKIQMSNAHKGKKKTAEHQYNNTVAHYVQVHQFDLNGNFIITHQSLKHAAKAIGIGSGSICSVAKGKQKACKGFKFSYNKELITV